jgi:RNA polymerase sigma-70 factor (ECF subfamily)
MLGTVADAEDAVQETFLRWSQTDVDPIRSPDAYLVTTITRLCIDHLRSARVQREDYIGPWLPEPLVTREATPADHAELTDSLSMAFLVMLETLSPTERAVFLLHDVFGYDYAEIAPVVDKTPVNCRQIARRARERLRTRRPRFDPSPIERDRLLQQFVTACRQGSMADLLAVLADEVTLTSDGGGQVVAARKPIHGAGKVAHFLLNILRKAPAGYAIHLTDVNGQPGFVVTVNEQTQGAWTFQVYDGRIQNIYAVINPDKLRHVEG